MPGTAVGFINSWKKTYKVVIPQNFNDHLWGGWGVRNSKQMYPPKSVYTGTLPIMIKRSIKEKIKFA